MHEFGCVAGSGGDDSAGDNINIGYQTRSPAYPANRTRHINIGYNIEGRDADDSVSIGDDSSYIYCDYGSSSTWSRVSDERFKKDFEECNLGLSFIEDLETVSYRFKSIDEVDSSLLFSGQKDRKDLDVYYIGLKAQNVQDSIAKYSEHDYKIVTQADGSGRLGMSYEQLITPLIKSVQDLSEKIKTLEAKIDSIRG